MKRYVYKPIRQAYSIGISPGTLSGEKLFYTPLHIHPQGEVHLLIRGAAEYTVDTMSMEMHPGDLLYIPKYTLHTLRSTQQDTHFCAFDTTLELNGFKKVRLPERMLQMLIQAGAQADEEGRPSLLTPWLMYLLGLLGPEAMCKTEERSDDVTILLAFINENYNRDITLADAARAANLSQRQVQRLIRKDTGNTFLQ